MPLRHREQTCHVFLPAALRGLTIGDADFVRGLAIGDKGDCVESGMPVLAWFRDVDFVRGLAIGDKGDFVESGVPVLNGCVELSTVRGGLPTAPSRSDDICAVLLRAQAHGVKMTRRFHVVIGSFKKKMFSLIKPFPSVRP